MDVTSTIIEEEFTMFVCKKHMKMLRGCSNISPEVREIE